MALSTAQALTLPWLAALVMKCTTSQTGCRQSLREWHSCRSTSPSQGCHRRPHSVRVGVSLRIQVLFLRIGNVQGFHVAFDLSFFSFAFLIPCATTLSQLTSFALCSPSLSICHFLSTHMFTLCILFLPRYHALSTPLLHSALPPFHCVMLLLSLKVTSYSPFRSFQCATLSHTPHIRILLFPFFFASCTGQQDGLNAWSSMSHGTPSPRQEMLLNLIASGCPSSSPCKIQGQYAIRQGPWKLLVGHTSVWAEKGQTPSSLCAVRSNKVRLRQGRGGG